MLMVNILTVSVYYSHIQPEIKNYYSKIIVFIYNFQHQNIKDLSLKLIPLNPCSDYTSVKLCVAQNVVITELFLNT